ncbi:hypothetical protein [Streptomyces sp. NPDC059080]|uniref:hypothetical protein n=1 Tax=Streptomyces sp. NPDC059080 TaxID=3346718 RepID=UPI0036C28363
MSVSIAEITRPAHTTRVNPEYFCPTCGTWHTGPCGSTAPNRRLADLLQRLVAEGDRRAENRRAPRTRAEMGTPPLDGPTANEDQVDEALFGPYDNSGGDGDE